MVYEYLHLVENIRTEKGPRQRLILNLGALDIAQDKYKELANCIEAMLTGQRQLFSSDPKIEKHARKAVRSLLDKRSKEQLIDNAVGSDQIGTEPDYKTVDVASMQANAPRCIGPEYVCHQIWNELKLNYVLF
ncbi:hypothetical protein ACFL0M_10125 [Thermodesulfobacteriota bacterium]